MPHTTPEKMSDSSDRQEATIVLGRVLYFSIQSAMMVPIWLATYLCLEKYVIWIPNGGATILTILAILQSGILIERHIGNIRLENPSSVSSLAWWGIWGPIASSIIVFLILLNSSLLATILGGEATTAMVVFTIGYCLHNTFQILGSISQDSKKY